MVVCPTLSRLSHTILDLHVTTLPWRRVYLWLLVPCYHTYRTLPPLSHTITLVPRCIRLARDNLNLETSLPLVICPMLSHLSQTTALVPHYHICPTLPPLSDTITLAPPYIRLARDNLNLVTSLPFVVCPTLSHLSHTKSELHVTT